MGLKHLIEYKKQLRIGIRTEREHHLSPSITRKIAQDHLREDAHYYSKLRKAKL
jgi:hypothetical protein